MHTLCIILRLASVNGGRPASGVRRAALSSPVDKRDRHRAILELVEKEVVESQESCGNFSTVEAGRHAVHPVRDLRELRLARIPTPKGCATRPRTGEPPRNPPASASTTCCRGSSPRSMASVSFCSQDHPGGAQPVAEALDAQDWPDVLGTIGGENTIWSSVARRPPREGRAAVAQGGRE